MLLDSPPNEPALTVLSGIDLCFSYRYMYMSRLAQSHSTVVIPLYKRVVFVRLLNCTEFSSRLSEISQTLDAITGKLVMENDVEK